MYSISDTAPLLSAMTTKDSADSGRLKVDVSGPIRKRSIIKSVLNKNKSKK